MDVEVMAVSPEDKAFIHAEAKRCQTSAAGILHRAILAYRSEPDLPDLKGRTLLDYFEPIDIEDAPTDGAENHDSYLREARRLS